MELTIDGREYSGTVVDLRERSLDPDAVAAAIRNEPSPHVADCPTPGPVHERAGVVTPAMGLKPRTALAAAARSRGIGTPHDERIEELVDELAALTESIGDQSPPEGEAADDGAATDQPTAGPPPSDLAAVRERAAELRGQVTALEDADADPTAARRKLRETAARLSELETQRIAADQARERADERRDRRERRLRLEDRLANARRRARAVLVEEVISEYTAAVDRVATAPVDDPFDAAPPATALGVLRVASVDAPVVLAVDRFANPERAADWLDASVVRL